MDIFQLLSSIGNDATLLSTIIIALLTGAGLVAIKVISKRTGVPTQEIEQAVENIHEQASAQAIAGIQQHIADEAMAQKLDKTIKKEVKQKKLLANKVKANEPEEADESAEIECDKPKRRRKPGPKPMLSLLLLVLLPFTSCTLFDAGYKYASENIEITWKGNEAKDLKPIDSIIVKSQPIYWKEIDESYLIDSIETEIEFIKDGYRVWQLRTPNWKRIEVQRLDTIIYIYKK